MVEPSAFEQRTTLILQTTRAILDERGDRDALISDIASAVGVNRAIIYRHFSSKDELLAMTVVGYLNELEVVLARANDPAVPTIQRLTDLSDAYLSFGVEHPAFVDTAQSLMRASSETLLKSVQLDRLAAVGVAMNACMDHLIATFVQGNSEGIFDVANPSTLANILYAQGLGLLNLLTFQRSVSELETGLPIMEGLPTDDVFEYARRAVLAAALPKVTT